MKERVSLEKNYQRYKNRDFVVLAVSIDWQGASVVEPFVRKLRLTFPHLLDPRRKVAGMFGIRFHPANFFINRKGEVVAVAFGYRNWDGSHGRRLIEGLLEE
ncbi:MAG: peroxiredoxin family protein [Nitrospinota bacterium]